VNKNITATSCGRILKYELIRLRQSIGNGINVSAIILGFERRLLFKNILELARAFKRVQSQLIEVK